MIIVVIAMMIVMIYTIMKTAIVKLKTHTDVFSTVSIIFHQLLISIKTKEMNMMEITLMTILTCLDW